MDEILSFLPSRTLGFLAFAMAATVAAASEPLALVATILLPHVKGRIDHLAADVSGHRLYVAALK